jgi:PAS domain S-box-containing protein
VEDEVRDAAGTTFFFRILPYRAAAGLEAGGVTSASRPTEGVVLSLTDISALDSARARLRQLSAIVESSQDAIIGNRLDGTITSWNNGAERLFGYSATEAIGSNISMLLPRGYLDEMSHFQETLRSGGRLENVETTRLRKDGRVIDISVTVSPICDAEGNIIGSSAIARDITQLKSVQKELAEREAHIRTLLDSTAEAIFGLGPDGVCTFCNPACVRMLGYLSADELIGRHMHPLIHHSMTNGSPHLEENCSMCSVLRTGKGTHSDEESLWRSDGTTFLAEYWSYPIRREGRIDGIVVAFIDITDRKHAEEEIRTAARRREEFLAMLSHELRNPLSAVVSAGTIMRSKNVTPEVIARAQAIVDRQSRHMARLLDDLLDVSRITRGGIELRKEDLDLRDSVRMAMEALSPVLEERKSKLAADLSDDVLPVRGDSARLQQVIGNLLSNAARYSPPGSAIHLSAAADGDSVVVRVKDFGRGIDPRMLSEIFELFVQNGQGLDRSGGGLGIGLTLVRKIVELHGGKVEARSEGSGKGSEFIVTLPRQRNAVFAGSGARESGTPRRILVVEDQDDSREMLRVLLESKGHVVLDEADGCAAVEAVEREHPDVALIDIGLPLMNGYDVARKIRENPVLDDVVLVALTGYGREADIVAAREAGFNTHLTKPADPALIDDILSSRARRKTA